MLVPHFPRFSSSLGEGWTIGGNGFVCWFRRSHCLIFIAKNEKGEYTWKLAKEHRKTVTSRVKPLQVGKTFAIQPGRGKKAVCRAKVISCENRLHHFKEKCDHIAISQWKQREAELEGFYTWDGLMRYFEEHNINFMDLYRIEFIIEEEGGDEKKMQILREEKKN